jgi:hypothetical protein
VGIEKGVVGKAKQIKFETEEEGKDLANAVCQKVIGHLSWPITEATKWWKVVNSLCILACPSCLHMTEQQRDQADARQT